MNSTRALCSTSCLLSIPFKAAVDIQCKQFRISSSRYRYFKSVKCAPEPIEPSDEKDPVPKDQIDVIETKQEQESSGPFGFLVSFLTWSFIIFLFAGSIFFTVSRQFLPDMQPLDLSNPPL